VYVVNVHLMAAPSEGLSRLYQVRKALRRVAAQASPGKGGTLCPEEAPLLLIGDFNEPAGEGGALPTLLTTGAAPVGAGDVPSPSAEWATCSFTDAHLAVLEDKAPLTWPSSAPRVRIDYIFHSDSLRCVGVPTPLRPDEANYPSDHLMIGADFRFEDEDDDLWEDDYYGVDDLPYSATWNQAKKGSGGDDSDDSMSMEDD